MTTRTKRAIHVAIATITLIVPASALALTGTFDNTQATAATPLQMQITPRHTTLDHRVTVRGSAAPSEAGQRAVLETSPGYGAAWTPLGATTTTSSGDYAMSAALRHSGYLRVIETTPTAVAAAVPASSSAPTAAASSAPQHVTVAAHFRVPQRSLDVLAGSAVLVRGFLNPVRAGRPVRLQGHIGHGWQTLATARTGQAGGFRLHYAPSGGVQQRLRVAFAGDSVNAATTRPAGVMTVFGQAAASWYNDAGNTACGFHATLGVANKSLPCGTKVQFRYGGRSVTATVDDRGPYVGGRDWDLNQNTAAALGFGGVGTVWVSQ